LDPGDEGALNAESRRLKTAQAGDFSHLGIEVEFSLG
jgi:hypothetical protein